MGIGTAPQRFARTTTAFSPRRSFLLLLLCLLVSPTFAKEPGEDPVEDAFQKKLDVKIAQKQLEQYTAFKQARDKVDEVVRTNGNREKYVTAATVAAKRFDEMGGDTNRYYKDALPQLTEVQKKLATYRIKDEKPKPALDPQPADVTPPPQALPVTASSDDPPKVPLKDTPKDPPGSPTTPDPRRLPAASTDRTRTPEQIARETRELEKERGKPKDPKELKDPKDPKDPKDTARDLRDAVDPRVALRDRDRDPNEAFRDPTQPTRQPTQPGTQPAREDEGRNIPLSDQIAPPPKGPRTPDSKLRNEMDDDPFFFQVPLSPKAEPSRPAEAQLEQPPIHGQAFAPAPSKGPEPTPPAPTVIVGAPKTPPQDPAQKEYEAFVRALKVAEKDGGDLGATVRALRGLADTATDPGERRALLGSLRQVLSTIELPSAEGVGFAAAGYPNGLGGSATGGSAKGGDAAKEALSNALAKELADKNIAGNGGPGAGGVLPLTPFPGLLVVSSGGKKIPGGTFYASTGGIASGGVGRGTLLLARGSLLKVGRALLEKLQAAAARLKKDNGGHGRGLASVDEGRRTKFRLPSQLAGMLAGAGTYDSATGETEMEEEEAALLLGLLVLGAIGLGLFGGAGMLGFVLWRRRRQAAVAAVLAVLLLPATSRADGPHPRTPEERQYYRTLGDRALEQMDAARRSRDRAGEQRWAQRKMLFDGCLTGYEQSFVSCRDAGAREFPDVASPPSAPEPTVKTEAPPVLEAKDSPTKDGPPPVAKLPGETKRDEAKRDETKRDETQRDETKRDETKRDEAKLEERKGDPNDGDTKRREETKSADERVATNFPTKGLEPTPGASKGEPTKSADLRNSKIPEPTPSAKNALNEPRKGTIGEELDDPLLLQMAIAAPTPSPDARVSGELDGHGNVIDGNGGAGLAAEVSAVEARQREAFLNALAIARNGGGDFDSLLRALGSLVAIAGDDEERRMLAGAYQQFSSLAKAAEGSSADTKAELAKALARELTRSSAGNGEGGGLVGLSSRMGVALAGAGSAGSGAKSYGAGGFDGRAGTTGLSPTRAAVTQLGRVLLSKLSSLASRLRGRGARGLASSTEGLRTGGRGPGEHGLGGAAARFRLPSQLAGMLALGGLGSHGNGDESDEDALELVAGAIALGGLLSGLGLGVLGMWLLAGRRRRDKKAHPGARRYA